MAAALHCGSADQHVVDDRSSIRKIPVLKGEETFEKQDRGLAACMAALQQCRSARGR
jgi:hypothetical protein